MRYGNANKVMCLSLDDQSMLWDSLCKRMIYPRNKLYK